MTTLRLTALAVTLSLMLPAGHALASSDAAVRWTSFSESSTCGVPYSGTPIMSRTGSLADSERILGPVGGYFGRTVGAARAQQVWWTVPMSGGRRVLVHRQALPAFQKVAENLAAEQANGRYYAITSVAAFVPRTIGGIRQMSRHTLGTAIDINPAQNPYSSDRLITDFPEWFIDAWRDAGFCWGGDWASAKDAMHFSWMGPNPGSGEGLPLLPPSGSLTSFRDAATYGTAWGDLAGDGRMLLADVGGFGALDVARLRNHPEGSVIDVVPGRSAFAGCSHYRWFVPADTDGDLVAMGDMDGDSRTDLVTLDAGGVLTVATRAALFDDPVTYAVDVPDDQVSIAVGDVDGDRLGEVLVAGADGTVFVLGGDDFAVVDEFSLPEPSSHITVGDREGDGTVEVFAVVDGGDVIITDPVEGAPVERVQLSDTAVMALGAADQDGDGRSDISRLGPDGVLSVAVGNSPTGMPVGSWWVNPAFECDEEYVPLTWTGTFYDDDDSEFSGDIELVASLGITRGCNPPFGDAYCPDALVTRGQMAAFLARLFELPAADGDYFSDDNGSLFENDIDRLAAAGITTGCTPTSFCPDDPVTRGQMAAFLVRGLGIDGDTEGNRFVDDDQSVFEDQIEILAASGVTRGCNPPANTSYCPEDRITRGQMAAFLGRTTQIR
jgi:hypothetical protein